jgi:hypothetical protein
MEEEILKIHKDLVEYQPLEEEAVLGSEQTMLKDEQESAIEPPSQFDSVHEDHQVQHTLSDTDYTNDEPSAVNEVSEIGQGTKEIPHSEEGQTSIPQNDQTVPNIQIILPLSIQREPETGRVTGVRYPTLNLADDSTTTRGEEENQTAVSLNNNWPVTNINPNPNYERQDSIVKAATNTIKKHSGKRPSNVKSKISAPKPNQPVRHKRSKSSRNPKENSANDASVLDMSLVTGVAQTLCEPFIPRTVVWVSFYNHFQYSTLSFSNSNLCIPRHTTF